MKIKSAGREAGRPESARTGKRADGLPMGSETYLLLAPYFSNHWQAQSATQPFVRKLETLTEERSRLPLLDPSDYLAQRSAPPIELVV